MPHLLIPIITFTWVDFICPLYFSKQLLSIIFVLEDNDSISSFWSIIAFFNLLFSMLIINAHFISKLCTEEAYYYLNLFIFSLKNTPEKARPLLNSGSNFFISITNSLALLSEVFAFCSCIVSVMLYWNLERLSISIE